MVDKAPASMQEEEDFPVSSPSTEVAIRICSEDGCNNPCKKRGRGYAYWCEEHLANHLGDKTPKGVKVQVIDKDFKDKVAKKAEAQTLVLLGAAQKFFILKNDQYCAWGIGNTGEDIAKNVGIVASDFKWVAQAVDKSDKYFALAMLTMSIGELALLMAVHHDLVPWSGPIKYLVPKPPPKDAPNDNQPLRVVHGVNSENNSGA